jgi:non-heme chloroperoxidase
MSNGSTPVVFVHGLFLHSTSWQPWVDLFAESGYDPVAPEWPGIPATVAEARAAADHYGDHGVDDVVDHYARIIAGLPSKPILVGHSFGGLIVQKLLGRDLGVAAVAIDPAPIKGVLPLPFSAVRVASVALLNPANRRRAIGLTPAQFKYGFGNMLSEEESAQLHQRWMIPTPGRPLFEAAFANLNPKAATKVDTANDSRGPLLLVAGGRDHTVPPVIVRSTRKLYGRSTALTELREFPDRGHSLTLDHGWRDVADACLTWLKKHSL